MTKQLFAMIIFSFLLITLHSGCNSQESFAEPVAAAPAEEPTGLPVESDSLTPTTSSYLYNLAISNSDLHNITEGDTVGLSIDLDNQDLWGTVYTGPYPFEAGDSGYDYPVYRLNSSLSEGKAILPISNFYKQLYDANSWNSGGRSTATPTIAYRLALFSGTSTKGMFGSFVSFKKNDDGTFQKLPTIVEGPFVTVVTSDNPTTMNIVWRTDELCSGRVFFGEHRFDENAGYVNLHTVTIDNLAPETAYKYYVDSTSVDGKTVVSNTYNVRTAPPKGKSDVTFVYTSDSYREAGSGGGETDYMGCNMDVLRDVTANSYRDGAEFMIFGGDLIYGMTTDKDNMILQYRAWKQIVAGFWNTRPIYPGMGNHEFLMNLFEPFMVLDRWPYETDSSEAIFAQEFYNPLNGPDASDPRRPSYKENVYSFQYGSVLIMSVNTCYWQSSDFYNLKNSSTYGGAPIGYIMEDQIEWIEEKLESAENDSTIKYIFLFSHAPVLPYMKHVEDALWWDGDNNIRAKTRKLNPDTQTYEVQPEALGIIEVRDRLLTAVTTSTKVAALFTSHEHGYHRTLISKYTPIGVYPDDDTNGDGILDKYSANPKFTNATWHIMCGGAGSGFNAEAADTTPWKPQRTTSHTGYVMIEASENKVGMKFVGGLAREVMDQLDDLMAVKNQ
ncbi:MAG: metallophosphoesterase family protein [Candidatus Magnetomorum sp.]|nr:metallophosphoesterase family protein [Candidatus Magnetomorum sp.]